MAKGKAMTAETANGIRQMYEQGELNKSKLARIFGVSVHSVYQAIGKEDPASRREKRQEAMGRIAGTMTDRIEALLNSVKEIPKGASYQQRMVAIGILTDKVEKLDKRLEEAKHDDVLAALPMPETVEAMAAALRSEIRQVNFILNLVPEGRQIVEDARRIEIETSRPIVDAEVLDISDLDGGQ